MSAKNYDNHNRWRNKTVAFRVSAEEDLQLETLVRMSGLTKQDYITRRLLCRDVVVQGNPRVYKALRDQFAAVLDELRRIEAGAEVKQIFIPFFSTKPEGSGIGLSLSRQMMRQHNGSIYLAKSNEKETVFTLIFR